MRWLNVVAIAETPEPKEFPLEPQRHLRRCHPASDKAALDLRCIVARRLSLLGPADQLSFLFKKASPRGLSSSTSCALFTRDPMGKATGLCAGDNSVLPEAVRRSKLQKTKIAPCWPSIN
jgi:hypothetical protein